MRFSFDDAERLPELLKAIPESEILRKQRNIRKVWKRCGGTDGHGGGRRSCLECAHQARVRDGPASTLATSHSGCAAPRLCRYSWSSLKWFRQIARDKLTANWALNPEDETNSTEIPERQRPYDPASGDAFQTLMEWLYGQMEKSEGG